MKTVSLDEAQQNLPELVAQLSREREVTIISENRPVARLVSAIPRGSLKDIRPSSVNAVLRPYPSPDDDVLGEMLGAA